MNKLLIVDDEEINRATLEAGFSDLYEIIQAEDGQKALDCLYNDEMISAVLLDLNMPRMSGFDVLKELNEVGFIEKIPVFIITSENKDDELLRAYELGAVDVISKPYNIQFLRRHLANTIELYTQRNNLSQIVEEKTQELIRQNNRLVEAMADVVEFRSNESGSHVKRVSGYTKMIMEGIVSDYPECRELEEDIESISFAACLHDLGKITIPDYILNKPGKYTPDEFEVMKTHTIHGYEQISALKDIMSPKLYEYSLDIARHHHERYDGGGYPDKLKGEEIKIWSQAAGLADVYDALTSERCYKDAFNHEKAVDMILNGECGCFNPKVIGVFDKLKNKFNELRQEIKRKKILIIDDSVKDKTLLKTVLSADYDLYDFGSGLQILSHLKQKYNEYDAVIIDINNQTINSFDLLRQLGKDFVYRTPVIMCSAEVNKESAAKAADVGVRAFLKKPFDFENTIKKVKSVVKD